MSGPVLCGLPSVAPLHVGQPLSAPYATRPQPCTELYSKQRSTCLSLPPLARYPGPVLVRKRWGEDNSLVKSGDMESNSGRNNFNCCHSVPDVLSAKYEGYMYPKPMYQDISVLRRAPFSTSRYFQGDTSTGHRELFPTHNPFRTANDGTSCVLQNATRQALSDYISRLYRTSRYDLEFKDTTDFMRRKADRDQQYDDVTGDFHEAPTCCKVLNHPDPCPYCWIGGMNKPIKMTLGTKEMNQDTAITPCDQCEDSSCNGNEGCLKTDQSSESIANKDDGKATKTETCEGNNDVTPKGDAGVLGPWTGYPAVDDSCEPLLLSHVYHFKLPSSLHNVETKNEYTSSYTERHGCQRPPPNQAEFLGTGVSSRKDSNLSVKHPVGKEEGSNSYGLLERWQKIKEDGTGDLQGQLSEKGLVMPALIEQYQQLHEVGPTAQRNSWTYRDEKTNLRIPCISRVIGFRNKTDAHNRIHIDHPTPIPDLRDFKRYSKRVMFFGYNSHVFQ